MQPRCLSLVLSLSALLAVPAVTHAAGGIVVPGGNKNEQKKMDAPKQVLKFVASKDLSIGGHKRVAVGFTPIDSTRQIQTLVAFKDDKSYETDEKIEATVGSLKPGDYVETEIVTMNGAPTLKYAKKIEVKPGEETPHGFVYQESYNDQQTGAPLVRLTKLGQSYEVTLPNVRGEKGKLEPDPDMVNAVQALKASELVYAQIAPGRVPTLMAIFPYKETQTGKVTKVSEQEVTDGKTEAVEIETADGKSVTALAPGKVNNKRWTPDPIISRLVHGLKPGTEVTFLTRDQDGKQFLVEIAKALPTPKAAGGSKSASTPNMEKPETAKAK